MCSLTDLHVAVKLRKSVYERRSQRRDLQVTWTILDLVSEWNPLHDTWTMHCLRRPSTRSRARRGHGCSSSPAARRACQWTALPSSTAATGISSLRSRNGVCRRSCRVHTPGIFSFVSLIAVPSWFCTCVFMFVWISVCMSVCISVGRIRRQLFSSANLSIFVYLSVWLPAYRLSASTGSIYHRIRHMRNYARSWWSRLRTRKALKALTDLDFLASHYSVLIPWPLFDPFLPLQLTVSCFWSYMLIRQS